MTLWRLSNHEALDGVGGMMASARWHRQGVLISYLAEHTALALLETLVHLKEGSLDEIPDHYRLSKVAVESTASIQEIQPDSLPPDWTDNISVTRTMGMRWLQEKGSVLLKVPSVVAPQAFNYLYNPAHPDASLCSVSETLSQPWDRRLLAK